MDLSWIAIGIALFAVTVYVLADGFDLGVGALLLFTRDEGRRDLMVAAIAPTWDGNETWLILAGVTLLGCFPLAYSVLLPAAYLIVFVMLMSLGARGVSFEFRFQTTTWRPFWDRAFSMGSILAAFCQGVILGGFFQGVTLAGDRFGGGVLDLISGFSALCGLTLVAAYLCLGAAWLYLKLDGAPQAFAAKALRRCAPAFAILLFVTFATGTACQPAMGVVWRQRGDLLLVLAAITWGAIALSVRSLGRGADRTPFFWMGVAILALAGGLAVCVLPTVVPFRVGVAAAASATFSTTFLVAGGLIVIPIILAYSAFSYWIFRGKALPPDPGG